MKHRLTALCLILAILMSFTFPVCSEGIDYESDYETALKMASNDLTNLASLQEAIDMLGKLGSYRNGLARFYYYYFQSLLNAQTEGADLNEIRRQLQMCAAAATFVSDLEARGLPACDELIAYIDARMLEESNDLQAAYEAYSGLTAMDAIDRLTNLDRKITSTYSNALKQAGYDLTNMESLKKSIQDLQSIGNIEYQFSKRYVRYLQVVESIMLNGDTTNIETELKDLQKDSAFTADLTGKGFPSCAELLDFTAAMKLETTRNLDKALEAFTRCITILDAPDRLLSLSEAIANMPKETPVEEAAEVVAETVEDAATADEAVEALAEELPFEETCAEDVAETVEDAATADEEVEAVEDIAEESPFVETCAEDVAESPADNAVKVGDYITFGRYPQTESGTDNTPIEWLVLDVDTANHKALLISRYGLDTKPYNTSRAVMTWEKCTLRTWLNKDFLNIAFTAQEQKGIVLTTVDNSNNQGYSGWNTNGGNNTQDKIFLLSYAEANKYFGLTRQESYSRGLHVTLTAYAIKQGAYTSSRNNIAGSKEAAWWWLRSPGYDRDCAARVYYGFLGNDYVNCVGGCVRPALWVDLDAAGL